MNHKLSFPYLQKGFYILCIAALVATESRLADRLRMAGFHTGRHGYDFSLISYSSSMPSSTAAGWYLTGAEGDVI